MGATKPRGGSQSERKIPKLTKKQEELLPEMLDNIQEMVDELQNQPSISREVSIVTTKLEEAEMWLFRALAVLGRDDLLPDEGPDMSDHDEDEVEDEDDDDDEDDGDENDA